MPSPPRRILLLLTLACALGPLACGQEEEPAAEVARPVKMVVFGGDAQAGRFSYPGRVFPNTTVGIAFEVTGKLAELPVSKGQEVEAGDLLAQLDQRDFRNDFSAAQAAFEEAEATRKRYAEAAAKRAVSQRELDEAVARARIAESELEIRKKALEDTVILADFKGIVSDRYVENFQQIEAKQPIMELQEISVLEIRVDIPEKDAVAPDEEDGGGRITAVFAAVPDREFDLEIKEFVTEADPVTQTFAVTLSMENPQQYNLLPGMTATVHYYPPEGGAGRGDTTVPTAAVMGQADREPWVWVIDDSMVVSKRPVRVGPIIAGDRVRIESGLEPGETIASAGAHHLAEGMKVREYGR